MDQKIAKKDIYNKHIMAIDYGRKFTGIATYKYGNDPYPIPWGRIEYKSDEQLTSDLLTLIDDEFIEIFVLGVPHFTDGKESTLSKEIKEFGKKLQSKLDIPLFMVDETLTTFEAEERMKNDPRYNFKVDLRKIDELCAVIILEQFVKNSSD